jgi:hypothetical protein
MADNLLSDYLPDPMIIVNYFNERFCEWLIEGETFTECLIEPVSEGDSLFH